MNLEPRRQGYPALNLLRGLLGPEPVSVLNYSSAAMDRRLRELLASRSFDVVQLEGVHLSAYLDPIEQRPSPPPMVCDWHNIESELMSRYAANASGARRWYARRTSRLLQCSERALLHRCSVHTVCSRREQETLHRFHDDARVEVVENGVDSAFHESRQLAEAAARNPGPRPNEQFLSFIGSMDYHANIDAAVYLVREIWPFIRAAAPLLHLYLVGARPTDAVKSLAQVEGVTVTGTVPDVRPYYHGASAVVAPLRVGAGTRLKILEAMAAGVPVVSTTLGAEGLRVASGASILLADSPEAFAEHVLSLVANPERARTIGEAGRALVRREYDWDVAGAKLRAIYRGLLESRR